MLSTHGDNAEGYLKQHSEDTMLDATKATAEALLAVAYEMRLLTMAKYLCDGDLTDKERQRIEHHLKPRLDT